MSRIATPNLSLGTSAEGEHPGAGHQTTKGSTGLNDNWLILDDAVGVAHNVEGTHKDDVIDGKSIKPGDVVMSTVLSAVARRTARVSAMRSA